MKIAQIGAGVWGVNHVRTLSEMGVLAAVCDIDKNKAEELADKYGVKKYDSIDTLLDAEEFDGVVIATPTSTHVDIAKQLISAKKHVFVEKPLTYNSNDGEQLIEMAAKNKILLTCGYIERFNPAVEKVKKMVKNSMYGDLIMLDFKRENRMALHIKDTGVIYDTSVHDIDTANWLFDDMPNVVYARAGRIRHKYEDFASIMLGYDKERVALITANWITPKRIRQFEAICKDAVITADFITQYITVEDNEQTSIIHGKAQEPLRAELESFVNAINGDSKHIVTAEQAVNVTKIAEAALLSSQKGVPIYLDLK